MIKNEVFAGSTLEKLKASNFEFYITGSKFFGGYTNASDNDFFVEYSDEAVRFLVSLGFYTLSSEDSAKFDDIRYSDDSIVTVMRYSNYDIQLVKDAVVKNEAQEFLKTYGNMQSVPKNARKYLWDIAMVVAKNWKINEEILFAKK